MLILKMNDEKSYEKAVQQTGQTWSRCHEIPQCDSSQWFIIEKS